MNHKLIVGYEFTQAGTNSTTNYLDVYWPNGWPYEQDSFSKFIDDFLTPNSNWNSDISKDKNSVINYMLQRKSELHIATPNLLNLELIDVYNVNDIHDKHYVFPFNLYTSIQFLNMNYFLTDGIYLSDKVKNDCRNGFCKILVYDLSEGHGEHMQLVKNFIETQSKIHSIPMDSFSFSDCNILTPKNQKSYGVRGFYRNNFEKCMVSPLHIEQYEDRVNFSKNPTELPYHFICLNRSIRRHRINFANEIFNRWNDKFLWSHNIFNFNQNLFQNGDGDGSNFIDRMFLNGELTFNKEFYNSLPKKIDIEFEVNDIELKLHLHEQAYINVVTETKFYEKNTIFFSEKIYKPIAAIQPFIVFSTANFLKSLRSEGYKTFHPFINEEYDTIEDDDVRFNTLLNEIDRLSKFTHAEMIHLIKQCSDICIYNYNHWRVNHELDIKSLYFINELKVWANELNFQSTSNVGNDNKSYKRII
jgi:hypothetical protein